MSYASRKNNLSSGHYTAGGFIPASGRVEYQHAGGYNPIIGLLTFIILLVTVTVFVSLVTDIQALQPVRNVIWIIAH